MAEETEKSRDTITSMVHENLIGMSTDLDRVAVPDLLKWKTSRINKMFNNFSLLLSHLLGETYSVVNFTKLIDKCFFGCGLVVYKSCAIC